MSAASIEERLAPFIEEVKSSSDWAARGRGIDQQFEAAASEALRAAALYERSVRLRRLARRVIPRQLRPAVKFVATRVRTGSR